MKSQSIIEIVQGDTAGIWRVSHRISDAGVRPPVLADLSDPDYVCTIKAVNIDGSEAVAERVVSAISSDNFHRLAALFPDETEGVAPGDITVGIQLSNATLNPPLRKEKHYTVRVHPSINANN